MSIGINLNPDAACNFDCVYCQVKRPSQPRTRRVELTRLRDELTYTINQALSGKLFDDPAFANVPAPLRAIKDLAFSGDGEPTTCKHFRACVELAATLKREAGLDEAKIVLITDGCYLTKPAVLAGLGVMDQNNGEIWAKLDAGTEAYYRRINRPNLPLQHVLRNITEAAQVRPVVIQSIFMRLKGQPPDETELRAYADRLSEIVQAGGQIAYVQVYTIARPPAEDYVTALSNEGVDYIVRVVRTHAGLNAEPFYAPG